MLVLPEGAVSMSLEDKPVGGAKTGPTGCGLLRLAHKPIIRLLVLAETKIFRPLHYGEL